MGSFKWFPTFFLCLVNAIFTTASYACITDEVSAWNEDQLSISRELFGWLTDPTTKEYNDNKSARRDDEKKVFRYTGQDMQGITWESRSNSTADGWLYGALDSEGHFTGDNITFLYQDLVTGLRGTFVDGVLTRAEVIKVVGERCKNGVKELKTQTSKRYENVSWERKEPENLHFKEYGKIMDPYERKSVYIGNSTLPGANLGLFARRNFSRNDLVSYFGGIKLPQSEIIFPNMSLAERQTAGLYYYALGLNAPREWGYEKDLLLDVPVGFRSIVQYRTTLGHMANHSFMPNTVFAQVNHPVLGGIVGLIALKDIKAGDEVLVNYRYGNKSKLRWYKRELSYIPPSKCYMRKKWCRAYKK